MDVKEGEGCSNLNVQLTLRGKSEYADGPLILGLSGMHIFCIYFFRLAHKESKTAKLEADKAQKVGEDSKGWCLTKTCNWSDHDPKLTNSSLPFDPRSHKHTPDSWSLSNSTEEQQRIPGEKLSRIVEVLHEDLIEDLNQDPKGPDQESL